MTDGSLQGRRVVVTATRRADDLAAALERHGAVVDHAPTLGIAGDADNDDLLRRTRELVHHPPDIVVITTGVGLRGWLDAARQDGLADDLLAALGRARVMVRGPKANGAAVRAGLRVDLVAASETDAEIRDLLLDEGVAGRRIAIQYHGAGSDGMDDAFTAAGATVVPLVVYRWGPSPDPQAVERAVRDVADRAVDAVLFAAAPGAAAFLEAASTAGVLTAVVAAFADGDVIAAAVGDVTAAPLRAAGVPVLVPSRFRMGALARLVVETLSGRGTT